MSIEVKVPSVGESINEGLLVEWEKESGTQIAVDDPLFVLETDKVTMTINAEAAGLLEILVKEGETVTVGQVVGRIDGKGASAGDSKAAPQPETELPAETRHETPAAASREDSARQKEESSKQTPGDAGETGTGRGEQVLSPAVRRLVQEHDLNPSRISGSGRGGRITKEDVVLYLDRAKKSDPDEKSPGELQERDSTAVRRKEAPKAWPQPVKEQGERQTRTPMSSLRKRIAQRLVQSQQTSAILTTFNEADMTQVMALRSKHKENFKGRHGVTLGFMSFFVKASVEALKTVPQINAQIEGDEIIQNHFYDIGVAVGTEHGLVVPVVRDADSLSFADVERTIADLAARAGSRSLTLDDLTGGCFTVSNGGVYGSLLSTPILNPPQSGILGMHSIKKRPVVVDDEIQIRPMMYLALSYDHRLVDGREAVAFLRRVVECIEDPERILLEI